jgi:glutathione peroxidase-family protein
MKTEVRQAGLVAQVVKHLQVQGPEFKPLYHQKQKKKRKRKQKWDYLKSGAGTKGSESG